MTLSGRRLVLVEDDSLVGGSLVQRLELEGARVQWLRHANRALGALRTPQAPVDAVICDIVLPDGDGEALFVALSRSRRPPPFLFITAHGSIAQAVRLTRSGAGDYIEKPFAMDQFLARLATLIAVHVAEADAGWLGPSEPARRTAARLDAAAAGGQPVLIAGEPGSGKGRLARSLHDASDRRGEPFVTHDLSRAAVSDLPRALAEAGSGTVYLAALHMADEAGQAAILDLLEARPACRVVLGGVHDRMEGLREDLRDRLRRHQIVVPPLASRPEDAVWLLRRIFAGANARRARPLCGISEPAEDAARAHGWPGGGRELRARVIRAVDEASDPWLQAADLFPEREAETAWRTLAEARDEAERAQIVAALTRSGGRPAEAARLLGVSRTTLWEKMQRLGL